MPRGELPLLSLGVYRRSGVRRQLHRLIQRFGPRSSMATCASRKVLRLSVDKPVRKRAISQPDDDEPLAKIRMPLRGLHTRGLVVKAFASQQSQGLRTPAMIALRRGVNICERENKTQQHCGNCLPGSNAHRATSNETQNQRPGPR